MYEPQNSVWDRLESDLAWGVYEEHRKLERRRLTWLLREAEYMKRRRLLEAAFVNGAMREPGYVFAADGSQGPHRRNDGEPFAYHPQFEEFEDDVRRMSVVDRIKSKAQQANGVVGRVVKKVEAGLDDIIGREEGLLKHADNAFAPHLSALSETKDTLDGVESALNVLSNGGPALEEMHPLPESAPAAPVSEAPKV